MCVCPQSVSIYISGLANCVRVIFYIVFIKSLLSFLLASDHRLMALPSQRNNTSKLICKCYCRCYYHIYWLFYIEIMFFRSRYPGQPYQQQPQMQYQQQQQMQYQQVFFFFSLFLSFFLITLNCHRQWVKCRWLLPNMDRRCNKIRQFIHDFIINFHLQWLICLIYILSFTVRLRPLTSLKLNLSTLTVQALLPSLSKST